MTCKGSLPITVPVCEDEVSDQHSGSSSLFQQTMQIIERRKNRRFPLHWRVRFSNAVDARTENINSRGFYCILDTPPVPGDIMECELTVPNYGPTSLSGLGLLLCQAEVVRVEARGSELGFGVAFRILDFTIAKRHTHAGGGSFND